MLTRQNYRVSSPRLALRLTHPQIPRYRLGHAQAGSIPAGKKSDRLALGRAQAGSIPAGKKSDGSTLGFVSWRAFCENSFTTGTLLVVRRREGGAHAVVQRSDLSDDPRIAVVYSALHTMSDAGTGVRAFQPLKPGLIVYGINEGGCYLCGDGSSFTASVAACEQVCRSDPDCVAFKVSRSPLFPAYEYRYGSPIDCCVERRTFSADSGLFHDGATDTTTNCGKDSLCWTLYNKMDPTASCPLTQPDFCWISVSLSFL